MQHWLSPGFYNVLRYKGYSHWFGRTIRLQLFYKHLEGLQPGTQSALLLGDAYISVLEPEKAMEVYETENPRDATLASKIGQALVRTHHYNKVST